VGVVEVVTLKQHICAIVFLMCALIHQNMYFGIQYTLRRRHIITYSSQTVTSLMPSSRTSILETQDKNESWIIAIATTLKNTTRASQK
jgi:ArsR family metal-binding transcriptional regulator